jgi:anti-sigma factor RsiW
MNCPQQHHVARYHDTELDASARASFERHLDECAACRQELQSLRAISSMLAEIPPAEPSAQAIQAWSTMPLRMRDRAVLRLTGWMTAAAAAVLVVATTWNLWSPTTSVGGELDLGPIVLTTPDESTTTTLEAARWMAMDLSAVSTGGVQR